MNKYMIQVTEKEEELIYYIRKKENTKAIRNAIIEIYNFGREVGALDNSYYIAQLANKITDLIEEEGDHN